MENSQVIRIKAESDSGCYTLIVHENWIGLYNSKLDKFVWQTQMKSVSSDEPLPGGGLS